MPDRDLIGSPDEPDPIALVRISRRARDHPRPSTVVAAARSAVRDPVIVILTLAGIGDWVSGNPVHSILLFAVAIALTGKASVDVEGRPRAAAQGGDGTAGRTGMFTRSHPLVVLGAVVYAVLVGGFARYSWPATVAVIVPGAAAIVVAWRSPASPATAVAPEPIGALAWASLFAALGLFELTNLLLQPSLTTDSYAHPTLSVLTDPLLATHPGRSVGFLLWLAGGWFLVRR